MNKSPKAKSIAVAQSRISHPLLSSDRKMRGLVLPLFLISGAAGLIYEVAWMRALGVVFGNTVFAASTVLTAFMLGLAAGSFFFGKIADRTSQPLKVYALLELGVGVYAFIFPSILGLTDPFYSWFFRTFNPSFYPLSLVIFLISVVILLFPTALMGGTLPVLSSLWADSSRGKEADCGIGQSVGLLYAINTFGAVAGSFLSGYLLLWIVGVSNTIYLAGTANVVIGILSLILSRQLKRRQIAKGPIVSPAKQRSHEQKLPEASDTDSQFEGKHSKEQIIVLAAVALAGFCALALEVLFTKVLVFVLGTSAYAFACMLTCFIFGIGLGSFLCSRFIVDRIKSPLFWLGAIESLIAVSVLGSIPLSGKLWHIDYVLMQKVVGGRISFAREAAAHFLDSAAVLFIPTLLMGAAFPIAVRICTPLWKAVGKRVGQLYAYNTIGCVIGSFTAGFVMVPLLALRDSFLLIVAIQLLLGAAIILFSQKRRFLVGIPAATLSLAIIVIGFIKIPQDVFLRTINTYHYPSEIVFLKDDATGTVTVHDTPDGNRLIAVDGIDVAGMDLMLRTTQKLQGYVPLLVHKNPKKVLQIGFGSGETSGVGLGWGVDEYNIAEICPAVFEAGKFFEKINRGSYQDPKLNKIIMDGKNFVKLTSRKFDVIMNDSTYPGTTGSSALYTYDHFKECREHLNEGGVLSCWVPLDLRPEDFQIIVRSFQAVMPYCSLWMGLNTLNKHAVLLGTLSPLQIDFQRAKNLIERPHIAADLKEINIHSIYDLLDCFVVGKLGLQRIAGKGPLNTDDKPFLEFDASIKRDDEGCWIVVLSWISDNYFSPASHVTNLGQTAQESQQIKTTLQQYSTATEHTLRGLLGLLQGDPDITNYEFEMAAKANPQDRDIPSCLDELKVETKSLEQVVAQAPTSAPLRSRLAKRYFLLRDYRKAAEQYNSFLQLKPNIAAAWNNLGICYQKLEQFEKAVGALQQALKYDAAFVPAYINLADSYSRLSNFTAALQNLQKVLPISPPSQRVFIYDRMAKAYLMQKQYDLALEAIQKAIELAANEPALLEHLENRKAAIKHAAEGTQP
jgi:spermidine synthase